MSAETEPQPSIIDKRFVEKISRALRSRCDQAEYPYTYRDLFQSTEQWFGTWAEGDARISFTEMTVEPRGILALMRIRESSKRIHVFKQLHPQENFGFASITMVLDYKSAEGAFLHTHYDGDWADWVGDSVRVNHTDDIALLEGIATGYYRDRVFDQDELHG